MHVPYTIYIPGNQFHVENVAQLRAAVSEFTRAEQG
jgi:hypothetical protein